MQDSFCVFSFINPNSRVPEDLTGIPLNQWLCRFWKAKHSPKEWWLFKTTREAFKPTVTYCACVMRNSQNTARTLLSYLSVLDLWLSVHPATRLDSTEHILLSSLGFFFFLRLRIFQTVLNGVLLEPLRSPCWLCDCWSCWSKGNIKQNGNLKYRF